ncbi:MAG: metal-dependent hydrolase [Kiritimatiellae bacterium]|nr:metal-dependent hydrolase [Kiritimatiellia bacterium]MDW8457541.1 metal-dependent hydrolase [Verrucomicrobiota bacterium]
MPSPVGHSILGLAIGALWALPRDAPGSWRDALALRGDRKALAAAVFAANAPDLDYLPGLWVGDLNAFHHGPTHSILFVTVLAAAMAFGWRREDRIAAFGWLLLAGLSHLIADVFTDDRRPPFGIPLWWPISDASVHSPVSVFWNLRKREWSDFIQWHNAAAVGIEMVVTLPIALAAVAVKWRFGRRRVENPA